jgi:hypothetical protein
MNKEALMFFGAQSTASGLRWRRRLICAGEECISASDSTTIHLRGRR